MFSAFAQSPSPAPLPGDPLPVAIVGAGFSGTIVASLLARSGQPVLLIDGSGKAGMGTAYSTQEAVHLLNVPAGRMSAFVHDPDDFVRSIADEGGTATSFAERRRYGAYLRDILDQATASGRVAQVDANAIGADCGGGDWVIRLENDETLRASALVLATGNQAPAMLRPFFDSGLRFIANPWEARARERIAEVAATGGDVLLVGTGLTMVDTVLSLEAAGFKGKAMALSRRGQLPQAHGDFVPAPVELSDLPSGSLMRMWRWLRQRSADVGWRAAVDGLRPHSQALWQSFPLADRRRFMRHARAWWDVRRHRLAPEVARTIDGVIGDGRLEIVAGTVEASRLCEREIDVAFRRRGASEAEWRRFALVVNCTGPLHGMSRTVDPLLRSLLDQGLARPDDLDIGLALGEGSKVAGSERLWAVGPLAKGRYWEIVAVPDIREQAAAVAAGIIEELSHGGVERKERA